MQPDGTCGLSYSMFHLHAMESASPAAVHSARLEGMDSPPADAHVPDCTIRYVYTLGCSGGAEGGNGGSIGCGGSGGAVGGGDAKMRM